MGDARAEVVLSVGAQHAEGPLWDGPSARLWWVDIIGQRVHCFDPVTGADREWATVGQPGGVLIDELGEPLIGMPDGLAALDRETGAMSLRVCMEADRPGNRLNDMKVDSRGRIWAGSMAYDRTVDAGSLYRIDGGQVTPVIPDLTISNGPAIDEESGLFYVADTARMIVAVFDFDVETGVLSNRRRFLDLAGEGQWPDGMTIDRDGMVWLAVGRGSAVHRYRPDATLDGVIELPVTNPTSVAFGGADGADLYITTSWFDLDAGERAEQPLAGAVFRARPGITGRPAHRARSLPT